MTTRATEARRAGGCLLLAGLLLLPFAAGTAEPEASPHWDRRACGACHVDATAGGGPRHAEGDALCQDCHEGEGALPCRHASDLALSAARRASLPAAYQSALNGGRLGCSSCHDLLLQCEGGSDTAYLNPEFLRGGPFRPPERACLQCHDAGKYQKLNPHRQIDNGQLDQKSCAFCHAGAVADGRIEPATSFHIAGERQCMGCHPVAPHPLAMPGQPTDDWTHLARPDDGMLARMRDTAARTGIELPLDPATGKVSCFSCHDPHAAGVIPGLPPPQDKARLRMRDICEACHDK